MNPLVWSSIISGVFALIVTTIPLVWHTRKQTERVETKIENGLSSVVKAIHSDMTLTVIPTLTNHHDKINALIEEMGGIRPAIEVIKGDLVKVSQRLQEHTDWEESQKYTDTQVELRKILEDLETRRRDT